jgi:signal transduction histidine kinase
MELASSTEKLFNIHCVFECDDPIFIQDNALATHLYYIAQEATQNAIKHGKSDRIKIKLSSEGGKISLEIKDNGCGIQETVPSQGMGLRIMNYRAKMIHADLNIARDNGGGTSVLCSFRTSSE